MGTLYFGDATVWGQILRDQHDPLKTCSEQNQHEFADCTSKVMLLS